ncbi:winged helix-turn-helix transcriptional regulator [Shewanella dokdonensis]|uniref:Winged helix-turn-helix transcriptional regulator n=1 Tax=Shewanella dokdonensis TaxID=712036 RepID=A0ABX8DEI7_9GAMM|nr:winged helix-turn-helix domain-containing protein [Shewanella dokdonensis]QVK22347.1 winged helix-turn-helix transcriptional regulator [Shewanella dokdonensis]
MDSIDQLEKLLLDIEIAGKALNLRPFGEPQLGKRGLYPNMNSPLNRKTSSDSLLDGRQELNAILTILSDSDGKTTMIEIADKLNLPLSALQEVIEKLEVHQLVSFNSGRTL